MLYNITKKNDLFFYIPEYMPNNLHTSSNTSIIKRKSSGYLLVNSLTNAIDIANDKIINCMRTNDYNELPSDMVIDLYCRGHLTNISPKLALEMHAGNTINRNENIAIIAFCPTYMCNYRCTYCYQRYIANRKAGSISVRKLKEVENYIVNFFKVYREKYNDNCFIELFGGEPLLKRNKELFDWIIKICKKENLQLIITTNGFNIIEYLDKLLLNKRFIAKVSTTLDGIGVTQDKRRIPPRGIHPGEGFARITKGIDCCLSLGIPVKLEMNLDQRNKDEINLINTYCLNKGWFEKKNFSFTIGRVDDRMFTKNIKNCLTEPEALEVVTKAFEPNIIQSNFRIAFLKTTYYLAKAFGMHYNQEEIGRDLYNYCWATSTAIKGYYIDSNLDAYRCTYTVGNPEFKMDLNDTYSSNIYWNGVGIHRKDKCLNCKIAGYCSGGCSVSEKVDEENSCQQEKDSFQDFFSRFDKQINDKVKDIIGYQK